MTTATVKKQSWEEVQTAKVKAALKELGGGKNKICATLEAKKILGVPSTRDECPIARYLEKTFKNATSIDVDSSEISLQFPKGEVCFTPSKAISDFIVDFDQEEYYKHLDEDCAAE